MVESDYFVGLWYVEAHHKNGKEIKLPRNPADDSGHHPVSWALYERRGDAELVKTAILAVYPKASVTVKWMSVGQAEELLKRARLAR